jgi:hypothetical protein
LFVVEDIVLMPARPDGSLDDGFLPVLSGGVRVDGLRLDAAGKIYICGRFDTVNGYSRPQFARLNNDLGLGADSVSFVQTNHVVKEDVGNLVFTVRRTGGSRGPVLVNCAVTNAEDEDRPDFTAATGWVRFEDGDTNDKQITIPIVNDSLSESNETFRVCPGNPLGGVVLGQPHTSPPPTRQAARNPTHPFSEPRQQPSRPRYPTPWRPHQAKS